MTIPDLVSDHIKNSNLYKMISGCKIKLW